MEWFFKNYPNNVTVELKVDNNKVLPHQEIALKQVHEGKFKYKIPDMGRRNPFDFIVIKIPKSVDAFRVKCSGRSCIAVGENGLILKFKV